MYKSIQTEKFVEIDEKSLPGYTALNNEAQVISNASVSSFYNGFDIVFSPFSLPSKEPLQASTVASVPVSKEGSVRMVLLLFNKLDENTSLAYFTDNDLAIVEAFGL